MEKVPINGKAAVSSETTAHQATLEALISLHGTASGADVPAVSASSLLCHLHRQLRILRAMPYGIDFGRPAEEMWNTVRAEHLTISPHSPHEWIALVNIGYVLLRFAVEIWHAYKAAERLIDAEDKR